MKIQQLIPLTVKNYLVEKSAKKKDMFMFLLDNTMKGRFYNQYFDGNGKLGNQRLPFTFFYDNSNYPNENQPWCK